MEWIKTVTKIVGVCGLFALRRRNRYMKDKLAQIQIHHNAYHQECHEELIQRMASLESEVHASRSELINGDEHDIQDPIRPWVDAPFKPRLVQLQRHVPVTLRKSNVDINWGSIDYRGTDLFHTTPPKPPAPPAPSDPDGSASLPVSVSANPWFYCVRPTPRQNNDCTVARIIHLRDNSSDRS